MAISLYDTLTPAGPPNVTVTEIDAPAVVAGEPYEIEFSPLIATGEYYVGLLVHGRRRVGTCLWRGLRRTHR